MFLSRRDFIKLSSAGLGGLLSGCRPAAPTAPAETPKPAPEVIVVDGTDPEGLDPPRNTGPFGHVIYALYEGLVVFNDKMEVVPRLATSWSVSADGSTWTFKLRPGVVFHDGTPFNSEAVKFSLERVLDPATGATRRANYTLIKKVEPVDDLTVRIVTDPPSPDLPFLLADRSAMIVSPAAVKKFGPDFARNPVGTGPFKLANWVTGQRVEMVPFESYWGPKPQTTKLVFRPIREAASRTAVLRTGEADIVFNLPPSDLALLEQDPALVVRREVGITQVMVELRQTRLPFSDVRVRKAVNLAVDKEAIIKNILQGLGSLMEGPGIPSLWGYIRLPAFPYDPEQARRLLAEAGYPSGFDAKLYYVPGRWAGDDQVAEAIQGYLSRVGVRVSIVKIPEAELVPVLSRDPDQMPGEMVMPIRTSFFMDYHLYRLYHSSSTLGQTAQRSGYRNSRVDSLLDEQRRVFDERRRAELLAEVQRIIWDDAPYLFLFNRGFAYGYRNGLTGFTVLPSGELIPDQIVRR